MTALGLIRRARIANNLVRAGAVPPALNVDPSEAVALGIDEATARFLVGAELEQQLRIMEPHLQRIQASQKTAKADAMTVATREAASRIRGQGKWVGDELELPIEGLAALVATPSFAVLALRVSEEATWHAPRLFVRRVLDSVVGCDECTVTLRKERLVLAFRNRSGRRGTIVLLDQVWLREEPGLFELELHTKVIPAQSPEARAPAQAATRVRPSRWFEDGARALIDLVTA